MSRFYLRYEKGEAARFTSHLDFLRAMTRTLRRAHIPVSFSQGFNPHPRLSFALPLPLGMTSRCELMELETDIDIAPDVLLDTLNRFVPPGLRFIEAGPSPGKAFFRNIAFAKYLIVPERLPGEAAVSAFLAMDSLVTEKRTKSGVKESDIRGDIADITIGKGGLFMTLSAGCDANLKPDTVLAAMRGLLGYDPGYYTCTRTGILDKDRKYL